MFDVVFEVIQIENEEEHSCVKMLLEDMLETAVRSTDTTARRMIPCAECLSGYKCNHDQPSMHTRVLYK